MGPEFAKMAKRIPKIICLALLVVFVSIYFYRPVETEDIWWHLKTGEWIFENKKVPRADLFPLEAEKITKGISPQWLGSTIYYIVYRAGGAAGLKLFRAILFLTIFGIFAVYSYRKTPTSLLILLILIMCYGLERRSNLRPYVFNYIFIQAFLIFLFSYQEKFKRKILFILPALSLIWSNIMPMGSFVYGNLLISIFLFSETINFLGLATKKGAVSERQSSSTRLKDYILILALHISTFLVNPYGLEGFLYPFKVFLVPNFINFYNLRNIIYELQPPTYLFTLSGFWFYLLLIFCLLSLKYKKYGRFTALLLFVFPLFMFLGSDRGRGLFSIISAYIIISSMKENSLKDRWSLHKALRFKNRMFCAVLILILSFVSMRIMNRRIFADNNYLRVISLDYEKNPGIAVRFLKKNNLRGPVFNSAGFGGFVIWSCYPEIKPFVDNRQFNMELYDEYVSINREPDKYWPAAENKYSIKIALLDTMHPGSNRIARYLHSSSRWKLVFLDNAIVIFVKKGEFRLPEESRLLEEKLQAIKYFPEDIEQLKNIVSKRQESKIKKLLFPPVKYVDTFVEGITLIELGYKGAALQKLKDSFRVMDKKFAEKAISAFIEYF